MSLYNVRDVDQGQLKLIMLIPELCYMTGLTDEMRSDFRVMKEIAQHTRLSPTARQECLVKFVRNVNGGAMLGLEWAIVGAERGDDGVMGLEWG